MREVRVFTIGCAAHSVERLLELLQQHAIETVVDARVDPRACEPRFQREALQRALARRQIHYVFRGEELGGRYAVSDGLALEGDEDYCVEEGCFRICDHGGGPCLCGEDGGPLPVRDEESRLRLVRYLARQEVLDAVAEVVALSLDAPVAVLGHAEDPALDLRGWMLVPLLGAAGQAMYVQAERLAVEVVHIRADGTLESAEAVENRILGPSAN